MNFSKLFAFIILFSTTMPVFTTDKEKEKLLFGAIKDNDIEEVRRLINENVDLNAPDNYGTTPLSFAVIWGAEEIAKLLLDSGADVAVNQDSEFGRPLRVATMALKDKLVDLLIEYGADVNMQSVETKQTPLQTAILSVYMKPNERKKVVLSLLRAGANPTIPYEGDKGYHGLTPLEIAQKRGYDDIVELLVMYINKWELKPKIFDAIEMGDIETLKKLLKQVPLSIAIDEKTGNTPLHEAIQQNQLEIVKLILRLAPRLVAVRNKAGQTPIELAAGRPDILKLLMQVGYVLKAEEQPGLSNVNE